MNVIVRELSVGMNGQDVRILQLELRLLGFSLPNNEKSFFGPATRELVLEFQRNSGVGADRYSGSGNWKIIQEWVEGQQPKRFVVYGRVMTDNRPLVGVHIEAFDVDIRRKDPLVNNGIITDELGGYEDL